MKHEVTVRAPTKANHARIGIFACWLRLVARCAMDAAWRDPRHQLLPRGKKADATILTAFEFRSRFEINSHNSIQGASRPHFRTLRSVLFRRDFIRSADIAGISSERSPTLDYNVI
jgi:hypothetical protein